MVVALRRVGLGLLLLLCPVFLLAREIEVHVSVESDLAAEREPIEIMIAISGDGDMQINEHSFQVGQDRLTAAYSHRSVESSLLIINGRRSERKAATFFYVAKIPGQLAGRYLLEPVSVVVNGQRYSAPSTTYEVLGAERSDSFRLEAVVEGGYKLWPGQRLTLLYRLIYRDPIDPLKQKLPFFESDQLRPIGERKVEYDFLGGMTVQELSQEVRTVAPGEIHFDSAVVEGIPYSRDFFGNRTYARKRIRAEAEPVHLVVQPFPEEGRPDTFSGALGRFEATAELMSSSNPRVGDKIIVRVDLLGKGEWETVHPPLLHLNDGFSSHFRLSDLPPKSETGVGRKSFFLEMRPLSPGITSIPSIHYAYFDPKRGGYGESRTRPIALIVEELPSASEEVHNTDPEKVDLEEVAVVDWDSLWLRPREGREEVVRIDASSLRPIGWKWAWLSLPFATTAVGAQAGYRYLAGSVRKRRLQRAEYWLRQARKVYGDPDEIWHHLEMALRVRAVEREWVKQLPEEPKEVPQGALQELWEEIRSRRYAPDSRSSLPQWVNRVEQYLMEGE